MTEVDKLKVALDEGLSLCNHRLVGGQITYTMHDLNNGSTLGLGTDKSCAINQMYRLACLSRARHKIPQNNKD